MSQVWADRQRRTNALVRKIAARVLSSEPTGDQIFGLCKLTWITDSYESDNAAYIKSTKIPAISDAIGVDYNGLELAKVASLVAEEFSDKELENLVFSHTGFTNFYKAYRNSARQWIEENKVELISVLRQAQSLGSDEEGEILAARIAKLPPIPKANHPEQGMQADFLMTPVCFALDPRLRFPIINGAKRVKSLLRKVRATDGSAEQKYRAFVGLIGRGGIKDAADLDQLEFADQLDLLSSEPDRLRHMLEEQPEVGEDLPVKEEEVERLQQALSSVQRRIHNRMTNQLRRILANWTLLEGRAVDCKYDVLVRNYDRKGNDLLIEVKSSADASQVRMAIGQVFSYWHRLNGSTEHDHCAVMLPSRPGESIQELLDWLGIGILWIEAGKLCTTTDWLDSIAALVAE